MINILDNEIILFQGDSITDCNRNLLKKDDLGSGYVNLINYYFQTHLPNANVLCYNRGIYGNRTMNLKLRWKRDCLNIEPTILSLLIGINDTLRHYDLHLDTPTQKFETNYRYLLDEVKKHLPNTKIILMSPFLLPITEDQKIWFEDLNPKIECVRMLATEYNTLYIPLQEHFNQVLCEEKGPRYWTHDGIHPTPFGHTLIAKEWIKTFNSDFLDF